MATEQFEVRNRWTNAVQFTAEIECAPDASLRIKLGLAVRWARRNGAVLSGADLSGAVLSGAVLRGADLRGAVLSDAVLSGADLRGAVLSDAVLSDAVLSDAVLSDAVLSGADLRGADLRGAVLSGAVLSGAVLSGAPVIPDIHQAIYAAVSQPGALDMGIWHDAAYEDGGCGTTHCRAGWAVALAGKGGRALEEKIGTSAAATLIYLASDPKLERIPNFYCSNEAALEDMRRLAEAEAA